MAFYADEEDVWRCSYHPSKLRRIGICPFCLRDRLATLCPHCANVRPCACCTASSSSSSSSSSTSSSFSCLIGDPKATGSKRCASNLIDSEPAFRRSRSLSIPFLRSSSRFLDDRNSESIVTMKSPSFWSILKSQKNSTTGAEEGGGRELRKRVENAVAKKSSWRAAMMMRSRSVSVQDSGSESIRRSTKGRGWHFPSPIKAFRQSRFSKVVVREGHH